MRELKRDDFTSEVAAGTKSKISDWFSLFVGRVLRPSHAATAHKASVFRFPSMRDVPSRNALPTGQNDKEEDRISSFIKCPLHAALWQSRSEPVKGLRCAAMNGHRTPALDRTRLVSARRQNHEGGHSTKEIWLRAKGELPSFNIPPHAGDTGAHTMTTTAATTSRYRRTSEDPKKPQQKQQQRQTAKEIIAANVKCLIEQLEAGHSDALTAYLDAMSRFRNYSFGNVLEIARQRAVTFCYTSLESMNIGGCASLEARDGRHVAVRTKLMDLVDRKQIDRD